MMGIYKIQNLINGKVYIGQSVDIKERWSEHKQVVNKKQLTQSDKKRLQYPLYLALKKYGIENFKFSIIEECSRDQLDQREKFWIKQYHSCIEDQLCNGYNITWGGQGIQKISNQQIDYIVQLWNQGKSTGEIMELTNIQRHSIIKYLKLFSNYTVQQGDRRGRAINGIQHKKPIKRYNNKGQLIAQYASAKDAENELNLTRGYLTKILKRKNSSLHNEFFIYSNENQYESLLQAMLKKQPKPVLQYDLNDNLIARYQSCSIAAKQLNKNTGNIQACCNGTSKTAYGFKWRYENPYNILKDKIF